MVSLTEALGLEFFGFTINQDQQFTLKQLLLKPKPSSTDNDVTTNESYAAIANKNVDDVFRQMVYKLPGIPLGRLPGQSNMREEVQKFREFLKTRPNPNDWVTLKPTLPSLSQCFIEVQETRKVPGRCIKLGGRIPACQATSSDLIDIDYNSNYILFKSGKVETVHETPIKQEDGSVTCNQPLTMKRTARNLINSLGHLIVNSPDISETLLNILTPMASRQGINLQFLITLISIVTILLNIAIISLIIAVFGKLSKISKKALLCSKELTGKFFKLLFSLDKTGFNFGSSLFHVLKIVTELALRQHQQTASLAQLLDIVRLFATETQHERQVKSKPRQERQQSTPIFHLASRKTEDARSSLDQSLPPSSPSPYFHTSPNPKEYKPVYELLPSTNQLNLYPFTNLFTKSDGLAEGYKNSNKSSHRLGVIYAD
uniref:Uncharacterized protein n=1 Tax=Tetranychus urticae TaxID=32264 RepID=T1JSM8_TETUR